MPATVETDPVEKLYNMVITPEQIRNRPYKGVIQSVIIKCNSIYDLREEMSASFKKKMAEFEEECENIKGYDIEAVALAQEILRRMQQILRFHYQECQTIAEGYIQTLHQFEDYIGGKLEQKLEQLGIGEEELYRDNRSGKLKVKSTRQMKNDEKKEKELEQEFENRDPSTYMKIPLKGKKKKVKEVIDDD